MKSLILITALFAGTAHAHTAINCDDFENVGFETAVARDAGFSEWDVKNPAWHSQTMNHGANYSALRSLFVDVYEDEGLKKASPDIVKRAALKSCQDYNASR
jgi:hypothetical protein